MVIAALPSGCGDDDGDDTAADTGATSSESATSSASSQDDGASATSGASQTSDASQSGSGSQTATGGSGSDTTSSDTSGSGDEADSGVTGDPVACGDLECGGNEVCVQPCCGGPAPFCGPVEGNVCPAGSHEVRSCAFGGDCGPGQLCCEDDPCVPDPPACVSVDEIVCERSPNSPTPYCNSPCFGALSESTISCECA